MSNPTSVPVNVNPVMRIVRCVETCMHVPEHVIIVELDPAPLMTWSLVVDVVMMPDHVADPAGTEMVAPSGAALMQSVTSFCDGLAATRFRPEPPHAASLRDARLRTIKQKIKLTTSVFIFTPNM